MRSVILSMLLVLPTLLIAATPAQSYQAGRAAMKARQWEKAQKHFETAVRGNPSSAEYHYWLGSAFGRQAASAGVLRQASLASKTRASFEKAVQLDPNHIEARLALIDFYKLAPGFMGGGADKALRQAQEIRKRDRVKGATAFVKIHMYDKKPDLARKELVDLVRAMPNSAEARYRYAGFLYNVDKNANAAFAELETGLRTTPSDMLTHYAIGQIAAMAGTNLARGEAALKKYLTYSPKDSEPGHERTHYWLGVIYEKQGRKADARQAFATSLRLEPGRKEVVEAMKRVS